MYSNAKSRFYVTFAEWKLKLYNFTEQIVESDCNFWLDSWKQNKFIDTDMAPTSYMCVKSFHSKRSHSIQTLDGSPVPLAVLPLVAWYLEGGYREAWGSCLEVVVPLAFPLEGNEAVFPVVPSRGCDTDGQKEDKKFWSNTDCKQTWRHSQKAVQSVTSERAECDNHTASVTDLQMGEVSLRAVHLDKVAHESDHY